MGSTGTTSTSTTKLASFNEKSYGSFVKRTRILLSYCAVTRPLGQVQTETTDPLMLHRIPRGERGEPECMAFKNVHPQDRRYIDLPLVLTSVLLEDGSTLDWFPF